MINYVVFDVATGNTVQWGQCEAGMLDAQAATGQRALATSSMVVDDNRGAVWQKVKYLREQKTQKCVVAPHGQVDIDETSRLNILSAALEARNAKINNASFSITWTLANNSNVTLNADQMIDLGSKVTQHITACFNRARALRQSINNARHMAALLAIDVDAGWP